MDGEKHTPPTPPLNQHGHDDQEMPLDTKLLSDAVIELNISRKNVGIYPPGHIQITRSIDRAFEILERLFEVRAEMTLGIAKDTLLVGQDYLDRRNPVYRDFALSLNGQGIAAVTFIRGLSRDELVVFHKIITTKPSEIEAAGGVLQAMSTAGVAHIQVQSLDYGSLHLTEEQEIARTQRKTGEKEGEGLWQDFVSHLSAGTLARPGQEPGVSLRDAASIDPAELARLLNERKLDPNLVVESYDHIITTHVRSAAERRELTREQTDTLRSLNNLLKDLHPELRKQFLSVAFQRSSSQATPQAATEALGGLSDDMVIEMLQQASAEGKEISPTLTGLVQKLSSAAASSPRGAQQAPVTGTAGEGTAQPEISTEHMQKLFEREGYEDYVSSDYAGLLRNLAEGPAIPGAALPIEEFGPTLEDEHLDLQIGRALLAFMEEDLDEEDYREFAAKLMKIVPGMLDSGNFALLYDSVSTLFRHSREKPAAGIRMIAEDAQQVFRSTEFMARAVAAFDMRRTAGREAADFLFALGPGVVSGLLDVFALDESLGGRKALFDLLCRFGAAAVEEARRRLGDERHAYVRNLVMLIRVAGTAGSIPALKPLLKHADRKVRMEALAALLRFKDLGAVTALREKLHSQDPDEATQAVFLAGQHRVDAVADELAGMLKKAVLFETDYIVNEEILRALGEIGSPRVLPEIEKLARANWTLHPAGLERMKETLFESLERYPRDRIAGLIRIGEGIANEKIQRSVQRLRERTT